MDVFTHLEQHSLGPSYWASTEMANMTVAAATGRYLLSAMACLSAETLWYLPDGSRRQHRSMSDSLGEEFWISINI